MDLDSCPSDSEGHGSQVHFLLEVGGHISLLLQHLPTHPGVLFYFNTPSDTRKSHATYDRLIDQSTSNARIHDTNRQAHPAPVWTWTHAPLTQRGMGYWSIFSCKSAATFLFVLQHLPTHPGVLSYFNPPSDTRKSRATSDRLID